MYCVKCGVKLADTEKKCPLCGISVYHPELPQPTVRPLYPSNKFPEGHTNSKAISGMIIFLFLLPIFICLSADLARNGRVDWSGYVVGALAIAYVIFALPYWFRKPHPVVFVPCDFAAVGLYLLYIELATGGSWFLTFALPVVGAVCLIVTAVTALLYYTRRGKLYIFGGAFIAMGGFVLLVELLMDLTFGLLFIGWSLYPLIVLVLLGGLLFYFAMNRAAREIMERKLFF